MMNSIVIQVAVLLMLVAALPQVQGRVGQMALIEDEGIMDEGMQEHRRLQNETIDPAVIGVPDETEAPTGGNLTMDRAGNSASANGNGKTTAPAPTTTAPVGTSPTPAPTAPAWLGLNLYQVVAQGIAYPNCGDVGQNDSFQGAPLRNAQGQCVRINICHGNAGFGWNRITVDRSALGQDTNGNNGHANYEHNYATNKRPDYFPGSTSVPNPRGAGINGNLDGTCGFSAPNETPIPGIDPPPETTPPASSVNGDPHFKTWKGEKFDYHGECDLLLVNNPSFGDGIGMMIQVRTTRIKYFSYIEKIGIKIGDDVLEFSNDVANVKLNGVVAAPKPGKLKVYMAGKYEVVRFKKSVIIRLDKENHDALTYSKANHTKIDLIARKIGWPSLKLNAGAHDMFKGSVGLLGDYTTGKKLARDGVTEINDPSEFAQEWQVRDTEPMLFWNVRAPQYPAKCKPPAKMMGNRLGISHMRKDAEKVCSAWKEDIEDCIFDVLASRDLFGASDVDAAAE